jgi:hypothetical protein
MNQPVDRDPDASVRLLGMIAGVLPEQSDVRAMFPGDVVQENRRLAVSDRLLRKLRAFSFNVSEQIWQFRQIGARWCFGHNQVPFVCGS